MQPMGNERSGPPNFPGRPATPFASAPPQATVPFLSSGPMAGSEASGYQTVPAPVRFNGPSVPSSPSYSSKDFANYQRFSSPQYIPPGQPVPTFRGPPAGQQVLTPPVIPSVGRQNLPPPVSLVPHQGHTPSVPMGTPPIGPDVTSQRGSMMLPPTGESSFHTSRPSFSQPPMSGYSSMQATPVTSIPSIQVPPFVGQQRGFVPPPMIYGPIGVNSRSPPQFPTAGGPPVGGLQGLVEEFQSLSVGSVPGSVDPGVDPRVLPRPLNCDMEPSSFTEMYPLNCHPRYLRLTTSAMPNSQSLLSRWHLPLGAVVHPLAEPPEGEEVPVVNFGPTGIIRCRRCRTYVNPYVTFTDGGRKWRCNICSLLNDGFFLNPRFQYEEGFVYSDNIRSGVTKVIERLAPNVTFAIEATREIAQFRGKIGRFGDLTAQTAVGIMNPVPGDYFSLLDANGRRCDADQRPELLKGTVEFVAPTEYMVRPPMPPLYFFLIDVSLSAVRSGMIEIAAKTIKSCLDELPGFPRTQIGFITYDSTLHFYNMKSSLTQPQMMVVADLDDIFVPLPDDLLVNLSESRCVVDAFLDGLPAMFHNNINMESAFGPALKAAFMVMSQLGGKLLIFQSTLPSLGVGRLKLRGDDFRIYGTDKEHTLRISEDPFYKQMAADLTKYQIGVNIYAFSDKYTDIASLGTLAKYTGGQVYYYPSFHVGIHKDKFRHELARDLTRETAWEAVMRIRCGKGVRFTTYHGHFMLRSTDLLALPAVDCDKAFAMQLSLEDTLLTTPIVYFQVALLYTSSSGERRIRVHTAAAPVVADLGEMYSQADAGAIVSIMSRLAIEKSMSNKLEDARHSVLLRIVKSLREYRNLYAVQHRLGGRMIYPESLKFLPLYFLSLCKSIPLRGGYADAQLDERCAAGYNMMIAPIRRLLKLLYPSLVRVDDRLVKGTTNTVDSGKFDQLPLTTGCLDPRGLFIYDDGFRFVIWFGRALSSDILVNLLGVEASGFSDLSMVSLTEQDNDMSRKLMSMLKRSRESDPAFYQQCHLVRQGEQPREGSLLLANLVEDQVGGTSGYLDWILQIHRQVQQSA